MSADTSAEGEEIMVNWRPNRNWNVRFTWNQQEVFQTNIATQWIEFAETLYDIMENTTFTEGYIPGNPGGGYDDPAGFDMITGVLMCGKFLILNNYTRASASVTLRCDSTVFGTILISGRSSPARSIADKSFSLRMSATCSCEAYSIRFCSS